ncbi:ABC transporter permease [Cohnella abietis]|uniref:Putative hemin transport system permease protein HrtB n=1 Tax=Cohnella abietis TaxID=2507935 RepID=A0A3T1CYC4_9BACL|nr:ABC transporter permease [Cohnella abietis]BBI30840.1 ABC transporter permease [Cohnella abietis]
MYLALREMRFAKTRYTLIMTIMLLVSFLVLFVTGLANGLAYANAASVENMSANYFVLQQDSNSRFTRSVMSHDQLTAARSVVGDTNATPLRIQMTTVTQGSTTLKTDVTLFAIDMDSWLAPAVVEGSGVSNDSVGHVIVDQKLKDSGFTIGSPLRDQVTGMTWTISGFVKDESYSHTPVVFMNKQDWQQLKQQSVINGDSADQPPINTIAVKANSNQALQLQKELGDVEVITKGTAVSAIPGYKEEQGSLLMMIAFLFVISAFVLAVFFYVITIQKTSQFGILKAIGTNTGYLARSVFGQVLVLSIGSQLISLLLIKILSMALPESLPFKLDTSTIIFTCSLLVAMSLAGSLLSVIKVARTDALDAIGRAAA